MNQLKQHARDVDNLEYFLTYADNNAVGYFGKQVRLGGCCTGCMEQFSVLSSVIVVGFASAHRYRGYGSVDKHRVIFDDASAMGRTLQAYQKQNRHGLSLETTTFRMEHR
jgi:hypothetical protein